MTSADVLAHSRGGDDRRVLVGGVLVALVLLAAASRRSGLAGAVALAVVSVLWMLVNGSAEGPVLWSVSSQHGLTATDLGGLAGLGVAAWRGRQAWRSRGLPPREAPADPPQW
jgi:hypothetical protein